MWIYLLIAAVTLSILYVRRKYSFWERLGVPFEKPKFPFGNSMIDGKRVHTSQLTTYYYNKFKGRQQPIGGIYFFTSPIALVLDLELAKNVLVRDFQHFHDRGLYYNEKDDPLSCHLFNIEGTKWTNLRKKLTPTFSSGKLKLMCPIIVSVAERFQECLGECVSRDPEMIEMKDWISRFTTDVIGTCAFGIECNSLSDPEVEFRRVGNKMFQVSNRRVIKFFIISKFKKLAKALHVKSVPLDVSEFFFNVVRETIDYRRKSHVQRNDFLNLSMQLMDTGTLEGSDENVGKITLDEVVAQAFVFFLGGYETASTTMSFCLYELSLNDELQDRARQSVRQAIAKHGGLNYDALLDMNYLEQCINESLRKYPPGANVGRRVTKDYQVPNSSLVFRKGLGVVVPVYAIHHDAEYYPDPERYDPDRFSPEEVAKRIPCTFMPFGEGPRYCIAARFGMMQSKVGIAALLMKFRFSKCSKTVVPLVISPKHATICPEGGFWFKVEKLQERVIIVLN